MARKGRKYNMNVSELLACGLGSYGDSLSFSLLNSFTITGDTICIYPTLTTESLQALPTLEYDERVLSFLDYLDIANTEIKEELFDEATFDIDDPPPDIDDPLPDIDLFCLLNENFLVYRFFDGFRVVNVGYANGTVQYKTYPEGNNPDNYPWQITGTFINNIDLNLVYVVEVRDFYNNEEVCKVSQIISLSVIVPSTTVTLSPKIARLYEITHFDDTSATGSYEFRTGCFQIDPSLNIGERIQINYRANVNFLGVSYSIGYSCVDITCKPNGCNSFEEVNCITNTDPSPVTCSFVMCEGDVICYNTYSCVNAGSYSAVADASLCMIGVNGLNTSLPIIDLTSCSAFVESSIAALPIEVSFINNQYSSPSSDTEAVTGYFCFNPLIPLNYYVDVELSAVTNTTGGYANIILYTGITTPVIACTIDHNFSQTISPILRVKGGQLACYRTTITAPHIGTNTTTTICLHDTTASFGLISTITTTAADKCVSVYVEKVATDVTFYVCNQTRTQNEARGYINTNPSLPINEKTFICFDYDYELGIICPEAGYAHVMMMRKGQNDSIFMPIIRIQSMRNCPLSGSFEVEMNSGDEMCYSLEATNPYDVTDACIRLTGFGVTTSGIIPHTDINKDEDMTAGGMQDPE